MNLAERILLLLSRTPGSSDFVISTPWTLENALSTLAREFPDFEKLVAGRRVLDFGCGGGQQCVALALKYGCSVVGIDTNQRALAQATDLARQQGLPTARITFTSHVTDSMRGAFDIVISQNSFEHFPDPAAILDEMKQLLTADGAILITFAPPWLAPYGSHMHFFCKVPWLNLWFSEKTVMSVRKHFRNDGAERYEDVESGLNKMTVSRFERLISSVSLKRSFKKYGCVKGISLLGAIPFLRELFINRVTVILKKVH